MSVAGPPAAAAVRACEALWPWIVPGAGSDQSRPTTLPRPSATAVGVGGGRRRWASARGQKFRRRVCVATLASSWRPPSCASSSCPASAIRSAAQALWLPAPPPSPPLFCQKAEPNRTVNPPISSWVSSSSVYCGDLLEYHLESSFLVPRFKGQRAADFLVPRFMGQRRAYFLSESTWISSSFVQCDDLLEIQVEATLTAS